VRRWLNIAEPADIPRAVEFLLPLLTPGKVKKLVEADKLPLDD
jgi:hypothetical protein